MLGTPDKETILGGISSTTINKRENGIGTEHGYNIIFTSKQIFGVHIDPSTTRKILTSGWVLGGISGNFLGKFLTERSEILSEEQSDRALLELDAIKDFVITPGNLAEIKSRYGLLAGGRLIFKLKNGHMMFFWIDKKDEYEYIYQLLKQLISDDEIFSSVSYSEFLSLLRQKEPAGLSSGYDNPAKKRINKFCPNCGTSLTADQKFCTSCGSRNSP